MADATMYLDRCTPSPTYIRYKMYMLNSRNRHGWHGWQLMYQCQCTSVQAQAGNSMPVVPTKTMYVRMYQQNADQKQHLMSTEHHRRRSSSRRFRRFSSVLAD